MKKQITSFSTCIVLIEFHHTIKCIDLHISVVNTLFLLVDMMTRVQVFAPFLASLCIIWELSCKFHLLYYKVVSSRKAYIGAP